MPVSDRHSRGRYELAEPVPLADIERVADDPLAHTVQTSGPLQPKTWRLLNDRLFARRPDVEARVYGFYDSICDLTFLCELPGVRRLSIDCLHGEVRGIEKVGALPELEALGVGVWQQEDFDFLERVPATLRSLSLFATRSKKPSLERLERFPRLERLYLEGHHKRIEVLGELQELREVTLRSITLPDVSVLAQLPHLRSVDLKLGGTRNLEALKGVRTVRYLEIWQVRGFDDLSLVGDLPGLQFLFLQSLSRVNTLPSFANSTRLRRVVLVGMKSLSDFTTLRHAPALEEFALIEGHKNQPEELTPALKNEALKRAIGGFGSQRKNDQFENMCREARIEKFDWTVPFEFDETRA